MRLSSCLIKMCASCTVSLSKVTAFWNCLFAEYIPSVLFKYIYYFFLQVQYYSINIYEENFDHSINFCKLRNRLFSITHTAIKTTTRILVAGLGTSLWRVASNCRRLTRYRSPAQLWYFDRYNNCMLMRYIRTES